MHLKKGKGIEQNTAEMSYDEMKEIYNVTENYESAIFVRFHWVDAHTGATCVSPPFMIDHGVGFVKENVNKMKEMEDKPYMPKMKWKGMKGNESEHEEEQCNM